jgi:hypothetical protein
LAGSLILPPNKTLFLQKLLLGRTKSADFLRYLQQFGLQNAPEEWKFRRGATSSWTQIQAGKIKINKNFSER